MKLLLQLAIAIFIFLSCKIQSHDPNHIFYLHGRIIELQGIDAVSENFGEYEYEEIIKELEINGAKVHSEIRNQQTDVETFCQKISNQIDSLINEGIKPEKITVIGASKGAIMAMIISDMNKNPINYILLAANNNAIETENHWNLKGRVLGIYEKTDLLAGKNYDFWIEASTDAIQFHQVEINTGLGHGFLYKPIKDWMEPAHNWISKNELKESSGH